MRKANYRWVAAAALWFVVGLVLTVVSTQPAQAQTYNVIHNFAGARDGAYPDAGLTVDQAGNFYGTTLNGGIGYGAVFELKHVGSNWVVVPLYAFKGGAFDANGCHQPTCTALWRGEAIGAQAALLSTPAVANGVLFVGENNGMVEVFDANGCGDSICLPLTQLHTNNEPIVSSSPAVVNGTIYFGSADQFVPPIGRLYVFKLSR